MATYTVDASQVFRFGREGRDWRFVLPGEEEFTPEKVLDLVAENHGGAVAEALERSKQPDFMLEEWLEKLAKPDADPEVETDDDGNPIDAKTEDDGEGSDTGDGGDATETSEETETPSGDGDDERRESDENATEPKGEDDGENKPEGSDTDGPVMTSDQLSSDDVQVDAIPEAETKTEDTSANVSTDEAEKPETETEPAPAANPKGKGKGKGKGKNSRRG
jgi:hypothetical protein